MKRLVPTVLVGAALLALSATVAGAANKYPPGPAYRSCPDTLTIFQTENPDTTLNPCFPAIGDTVLGLRGIVTGFDLRASAFAVWFQTPGGGQYTGIQAFTGATNYNGPVATSPSGGNLAIGDDIVVYGTMQEFPATNGATEIEGPDVSQSTNDIVIRRISTGNTVPMDIFTTADGLDKLNWLPAFSEGEKYEGGLVRIRGPLKVGRISGTGVQSSNYLLTAAVGVNPDSVLIDNFTLSSSLGGPAPAVGTIVDSVQGIVTQNTGATINSYRIQLRNGNDVFLAVPPNLSDAYPIEDNQIRLVFDRNVDQTSAETESNYSLGSAIDGSTVDNAVLEAVPGNVVILTITSVLNEGDIETISVLGVGSAGCPTCTITPAQQRTFVHGVLTAAQVQAPDPANLSLFDDRSRYAGAGALPGTKLTLRATAAHQFGSLYYIVDEDGGVRGGVSVFGPSSPLVAGTRYRVTGQVQEFLGESEIVSTALITNEGAGSLPDPVIQPVSVFADTTTDTAGSPGDPDGAILTGEDYECMLVKLSYVRVTETRTVGLSFFVAGQKPTYPDTILVSNLSGALNGYTPPDSAMTISVTGLLHFTNGTFRVCPRGPSDIIVHGLNVGVDDPVAAREVEFSVAPNPARAATVTFALPTRADVELGVFDVAGRQVLQLAKGTLAAGEYSRKWSGLDASGQRVNPGVYFYRLKVGSELRTLRGILLQ